MIQRQQTLWLLLAALASFFSFKFPFYTGTLVEDNTPRFAELDGASNFPLLILTGLSVLLAAIAIFLFKDRKTQLKLAIGGIIIGVVILILYLTELKKFTAGNFALTAVLTAAILIGYIMAARGIRKDEKLIKSLNKLR
jgi:predicted MFS family arabinose efflux permease